MTNAEIMCITKKRTKKETMNYNQTLRKLSEDEEKNEPNESLSESDENLSHQKEIITIAKR